MTTNPAQRLRQKLLDLAIRGKLVPQDPKDEPADALLERIREMKVKGEGERRNGRGTRPACPHSRSNENRVVGTNAAAKELAALPIPDDEKPFDLPKGWTWCRLGAIGYWGAGATPSRKCSAYYKGGTIPWLKTGDLNDGLISSVPEFVTQKALDETSLHLNPVGSVLIAMYGATIGKVGILTIKATTNQACCACQVDACIEKKYLFYYLLSQRNKLRAMGGGGAQPNISKDIIVSFPIPLPPLAEQRRIVAKLDALMKEADTIAEGLEKLPALKDKARAKILDLAIRGKLVKQEAKDEPAEKLLARIREEHNAGRGTRPACPHSRSNGKHVVGTNAAAKGLAALPIPDDEKPFDLPKGWAWCRGRELFVETETKLPRGKYFDYIDIDAIDNKHHAIIAPKHLLVSKAPSRASRGVCGGDTLFSIVRPYLENIAFVPVEYKDCIASTGFFVCRSCGAVAPRFAFLLMTSPYVITGLNAFMKGDNSPSIRKDDILNFVFPLPPLAEQHRIVAKVDEMLAACEALTGGVRGA